MVDQVEKVARAMRAELERQQVPMSEPSDSDPIKHMVVIYHSPAVSLDHLARAAITAYNPNERLREALEAAAIHLRRSGDDAIVSVILADGREVDLIRERADGNFSHIIEPLGIARAVKEAR